MAVREATLGIGGCSPMPPHTVLGSVITVWQQNAIMHSVRGERYFPTVLAVLRIGNCRDSLGA